MAESRQHRASPSMEIIQAKIKTSSKKRRRKVPLRGIWSRGLPSLATNTVKMVVATLQLSSPICEEISEEDDDDEEHDDQTLHIGQQVQSHIPDAVLNYLSDLIDQKGNILIPNEHIYHSGTLLFLDVSGFTSLTEQYSNDAHLGIDQLTHTLNSYFDKLVSEILIHNGDIYKFAGDAILALWTNESNGCEQALKCAIYLQKKYGAYETDVGVILRLKVALAYGSVQALFLGTHEFKHYVLTGDCVNDVNICEQLCEPGDILLTKAAYEQVQFLSINCQFEPIKDENEGKEQYVSVNYSETLADDEHDMTQINEKMKNSNSTPSLIADSNDDESQKRIENLMKSFLLPCVYERIEHHQSLDYLSELRRVTIAFINLDISNGHCPKSNLCENVQKVFIQIYELTKMMGGVLTKGLLFDKGWSFLCVFGLPGYKQGDDTANALKCAQMIHSTIHKQCDFIEKCSIGVATGLTYCGVVGHVARCEYTVIGRKVNMAARLMCNYPNIISCDQETYYNSRLHSRYFQILPDKILKGMTNVGVVWQYGDHQENNLLIEGDKQKINDFHHETNYPLLGRKLELMIVAAQIMILDEPFNTSNRRRDLAAIIFEGDDKIGRSRLLKFIADCFETANHENTITPAPFYDHTYIPHDSTIPNHLSVLTPEHRIMTSSSLSIYSHDYSAGKKASIRVINYSCQLEQRFNEFSLLRSLLRQLLQFHHSDKSEHEREQSLLRLFDRNKSTDLYLRRNLFLLNDLLDVRFRRSHIETESNNEKSFVRTYETNINELLLHILNQLIEAPLTMGDLYGNILSSSCTQLRISTNSMSTLPTNSVALASKILFIIDDIHFADESSLKHLLTLGSHSKCLLILSMKPPRNNNNDRPASNILQTISTDSRVYLRRLPGLELRYLATLGCQILSVHKLPAKLVKILNESCNGIPGFCEQILFDLIRKDKIYITNVAESGEQDASLIEGDADRLVTNSSLKNSLFKSLFSRRKAVITDEQRLKEPIFSRVCLSRDPAANDFIAHCQQNFQNYIMCRIDRLSDGESLLVKIAAVIGNTFSRTFLWQLVDPQSRKLININSCILDMMQRMVIECAYQQQKQQQQHTHRTHLIKCCCLQNPGGFPSQCRLMAFTHLSIREGIYHSLTDSLKRILIRNAIDYLEKQCTIVCLTCGPRNENPFLVQKQDDLSRCRKTRHQHTFVDIVKMAALREIDNIIKQSIKRHSTDTLSKPRSNTSTNSTTEPATAPVNNPTRDESRSFTKVYEIRRNSADAGGSNFQRTKNLPSSTIILADDDFETKPNQPTCLHSSSTNLTLISMYPCGNTDSEVVTPPVQVEVKRSASISSTKSNHLFTLLKVPRQRLRSSSFSNNRLLKSFEGLMTIERSNRGETIVNTARKRREDQKSDRFRSFFRYVFCQYTPLNPTTSLVLQNNNQFIKHSNGNAGVDTRTGSKPNNVVQENELLHKHTSRWRKVRQALIHSSTKVPRACPNDRDLLEQTMFSSELMGKVCNDLHCLNKQIYLSRTFQNLYEQSSLFQIYQSYVHYQNLISYVYDTKQEEPQSPNLNRFLLNFTTYTDLRNCQCADYVLAIYIRLVEYHTNLYDMYEKLVEEKRDYSRRKQFDRIIYYRTEICQLLLRSNCLQRVLVEIENGRKFLNKFQNDTTTKDEHFYVYQYVLTKYTYNMFEAIVLQRTRSISDAKSLCEQSLRELTKINDKQNYQSSTPEQTKEYISELSNNSQASSSSSADPLHTFMRKYRLEYLICQYHLLRYQLSRHQSLESIRTLLDLQYHIYPLAFSLPCTISLIEHFYCQANYTQCLRLIDQLITFWWSYLTAREKLELSKLKSLSLIIELKQGSLESAIVSGYFAKRLLTGYHENIFLIETCIHLTLALIGEMRVSNIELILQHLEYLSEQTMNCYAKLWYYILVLDVAIELGYELLPITISLLENITKYRRKLLTGPNQRSLLIVYSDCTLAQIYVRLGVFDVSKIHFQQALHQIKYDQMHLSNSDFRFKRALLKLIETQLLHWFHAKDDERNIPEDCFLLTSIKDHVNDRLIPWNRTRYMIYQGYYDRLINDYKRKYKLSILNDFNWESCLQEAELNAIKLDREWIKRLRLAWSHSASEQISLQINQNLSVGRHRTSTTISKSTHRPFNRSSIPSVKYSSAMEQTSSDEPSPTTMHDYSRQKFLDCRAVLTKNNSLKFKLYILPVRV